MDLETIAALSKAIGRGFARLLSYAYGGALVLVVFRIVDSGRAAAFFEKLSWELAIFACIVIGAGVYRAHRSAIVPIHHWIGCFLFWLWDKMNGTLPTASVSPTRWFSSLEVGRCRRMLAYNILRHDPTFMTQDEQDSLDLKHAEFGLVVMAAEVFLLGAVYAGYIAYAAPAPPQTASPWNPPWWVWIVVSIFLFAASYPAPLQQHAIECLRWRTREDEEEAPPGTKTRPVTTTLKKYGLVKGN